MDYVQSVSQSAKYIESKIGFKADTAIVLGSGLGALAQSLENKKEIPYEEIPSFPISTTPGHAGKMIAGEKCGKKVICLSGRFHYYEGYSMQEAAYYVRVLKLLGIKKLILTCAVGGIHPSLRAGDLVTISDHIKFFDASPLRGKNEDFFGPRFNDMSTVYTPMMREIALDVAKEIGLPLHSGVYAFMPGPSFETPAEIKMLGILGADIVGMSTVPEAIVAAHCGLEVLGIACVTNMAAGISSSPLSHEEVFETAQKAQDGFVLLIEKILMRLE